MKTASTYTAYGTLAAAVCVWIVVIFFATTIRGEQVDYVNTMTEEVQQSAQAAASARLHMLASGNKERAERLDTIASPDVPAIIDTITSVGPLAVAAIKISAALPAAVPKTQKDIHAVAFVIESSGSFAAMMRVFALFDALPLPSSIEIVDLSRESAEAGTAAASQKWHLNLKLRVLTTAPVSS